MEREYKAPVRDKYFISILSYLSGEIEGDLICTEIRNEMLQRKTSVNDAALKLLVDEKYKQTALNDAYGRIICLGFIHERADGKVVIRKLLGYNGKLKKLLQNEFAVLAEFWRLLKDFDPSHDQIIGHNIFDFDLLFLRKRSVINRVSIGLDFSFAQYTSRPVYDTLQEWKKDRKCLSKLGELANALGVHVPRGIDLGIAQIQEYLRVGKHTEVADNCFRRVVLTRRIYHRLALSKPSIK